MKYIIKHGLVFTENNTFEKKDIHVKNSIIETVVDWDTPCDTTFRIHETSNDSLHMEKNNHDNHIIDASGLLVIPGLIDIHSHGAVGCDFSDASPEGLQNILSYQYSHGITSYCPTSMTLPVEQLLKIFRCVRHFPATKENKPSISEDLLADIVGINMEGPFLDPAKKGAHAAEYLTACDIDLFHRCNDACKNRIRLVTVAPNILNADSFIDALKDKVVISLGHSSADYDTCMSAMKKGIRHVTHLYNAMAPWDHRNPGLIGAAFDSHDCMLELISDGIHVHPSVVRSTFQQYHDRIVLISDSMRATGLSDGTYDLGGQQVTVCGNKATLQDGTIAGSVTNLYDCMRTAIAFGVPKEAAIAAASINPAKSIGIYDQVGSISAGKHADLLLVDKDMNLQQVL